MYQPRRQFNANAHVVQYAFIFCYLPRRAAVLAEHVKCRDNKVSF